MLNALRLISPKHPSACARVKHILINNEGCSPPKALLYKQGWIRGQTRVHIVCLVPERIFNMKPFTVP
jgi:hypothetical protein